MGTASRHAPRVGVHASADLERQLLASHRTVRDEELRQPVARLGMSPAHERSQLCENEGCIALNGCREMQSAELPTGGSKIGRHPKVVAARVHDLDLRGCVRVPHARIDRIDQPLLCSADVRPRESQRGRGKIDSSVTGDLHPRRAPPGRLTAPKDDQPRKKCEPSHVESPAVSIPLDRRPEEGHGLVGRHDGMESLPGRSRPLEADFSPMGRTATPRLSRPGDIRATKSRAMPPARTPGPSSQPLATRQTKAARSAARIRIPFLVSRTWGISPRSIRPKTVARLTPSASATHFTRADRVRCIDSNDPPRRSAGRPEPPLPLGPFRLRILARLDGQRPTSKPRRPKGRKEDLVPSGDIATFPGFPLGPGHQVQLRHTVPGAWSESRARLEATSASLQLATPVIKAATR